jgi:hypothetical protein
MKRSLLFSLLILCIALFFTACGGDNGETGDTGGKDKPAAAPGGDSEGTLVAKEILAAFDGAVKEAAELVKDKPEASEVKPKLEALIKKYEEKMTALNAKYLALKGKDIRLFGDANGYLGENRGKHVFEKNKILGDISYYYDSQKGEKDVARLISKDLVKLLDLAVKR